MTMWLTIILVGLGSYTLRVLPLLLGPRLRLSDRADAALRRTALAAMTALMVLGVKRIAADPFSLDIIPVAMSLAVSATATLLGRTIVIALLCGAATYAVGLGAVWIMTR